MLASETRKLAREALTGKWGKAALATLVFFILIAIISFVLNFIPFVGKILEYVVEIPLTFGFIATLIKLKRGEEITYTEFFNTGFNNFAGSWKVTLWTAVKLLAPLICTIISYVIVLIGFGTSFVGVYGSLPDYSTINPETVTGAGALIGIVGIILLIISSIWMTIKSYLFKAIYFILFDNPNMKAKEIVEESAKIMKGNRWKYFCLDLSFIGWMILSGFTFGIGMLWLLPYITIAEVVFFETLSGKKSVNTDSSENNDESQPEVISGE